MNPERFRKNFLLFIFIGLFIGWCFEEVVPHVVYEWYYRTLFVFALLLPCIMNTDECGDIVFDFLKTYAMKSYFFLKKIRADYKNIIQKIKINLIIFFFLIIQPIISLWIMIEVYFYAKIYEKKTDSSREKTGALEKNYPNLKMRRYRTYKMTLLNLIFLLIFFNFILYMLILRQKFSFFHKQSSIKKAQAIFTIFIIKKINNIFFLYIKNFSLLFFNQINLYNIHNLIKQHFNIKILKKNLNAVLPKLQKEPTKKILLWHKFLKINKITVLNISKKKIKILKHKNKYNFFIQKIKKKLNFTKKFPKYIFKIKQKFFPFAKNSKKIIKYFFETVQYKKKYKTKQPLIRIKYGRILFGKKKIEIIQNGNIFQQADNQQNRELFVKIMPLINFLEVNDRVYMGKKNVPIYKLRIEEFYAYAKAQCALLKRVGEDGQMKSILQIIKDYCMPFKKKKVYMLISFLGTLINRDINSYNAVKKTHAFYAPAYTRTKRYQKFLKYHHLTEHKRLNSFKPQMFGDTIIAKKNRTWHARLQTYPFKVEKFLFRKKSNKKIENILFKKKTDFKNKNGYFFFAKHHNNRIYIRKYHKTLHFIRKTKVNFKPYKKTFFKNLLKKEYLQEIPYKKDNNNKEDPIEKNINTPCISTQKHKFLFKKKRKKMVQWSPLKKKKNFLRTLIRTKKRWTFFDSFFYYYNNWKKFTINEQKNYYSEAARSWTKNLIFKKFLKQYALFFIQPQACLKYKRTPFLKILKENIKKRIKKKNKIHFHTFLLSLKTVIIKFLILIKNKQNKITKLLMLNLSKFFKVKIIKKILNFLKKIKKLVLLFIKTLKNAKKTFNTFLKKYIFPKYIQNITKQTKTLMVPMLRTAFSHKEHAHRKFLRKFKKMFFIRSQIFEKGTDFEHRRITDNSINKGKKKFFKILKNAILHLKIKKNNVKQFKKFPTRIILNQLFLNIEAGKKKKNLKIFKKKQLIKFKKHISYKYAAQNKVLKKKMKFFRKQFRKKKKKNKHINQRPNYLNIALNLNTNKKNFAIYVSVPKKKKKTLFFNKKVIKKYKKKKFLHFKSFHNFIKNQLEFFDNTLTKKTKYFLKNIIKSVVNKQNQLFLNYNIYSKFNITLIPLFNEIRNKIFKITALQSWLLKKTLPILLQVRNSKKKIQKKPNKKILKCLKKNIQKFYNYKQYKNKKKVLIPLFKQQLTNFSTTAVLKKINILTFKNKIFFILSNILNFIEKTKLHLNYKKYFKQNITFFEENFIIKIIQQKYDVCFKENLYTTFSKFQKQFYSSSIQKNQFLKKYYNNFFKKNYYKTTLAQYEDFHYLKQSTLVIQNLLNFYTIFIRILPLPTATRYTTIELKSKKKRYKQINTLRLVRRSIINLLLEDSEDEAKTISLQNILRNIEKDIKMRMKTIVPEDVEKLGLLIKQVKLWKKTLVSHILDIFLKFGVRFNFFKKDFKPLIAINVWKNYILNMREPFHDILFNNPKKFRKYNSIIARRYQRNPFYGYQLNFVKENISKFFPPILTYFKKKFKIDTKSRKNFKQILQNTLLPVFTKIAPHFKKKLFSNMYDIRDSQTICFNIFDNSIRIFLFKIKFFTTFTLIDFFLHKGIIFYNLNFSKPIINPYTLIPDNTLISFNPKIKQYATLLYNFKQFVKLYKFPKKIYVIKNFFYKKYLFYKRNSTLKFFFEPQEYFLPNIVEKNKLNNFFKKNWDLLKKKKVQKIQKKIKMLNSKLLLRNKKHKKFKKKFKIQKLYHLNKRIQQKKKGFLFYFSGKNQYKGFHRNNSIKILKKFNFFKNLSFLKESDKIFVEMPLLIIKNLGQFAFTKKTKKNLIKLWKQNFFKKLLLKKLKFNIKKYVFKPEIKNIFKCTFFLKIKKYFPTKNFFLFLKKKLKTFLIHLKKIQNTFILKKKLKQNQTKILMDFWTEDQIEFLQMGYSNFF